MLRGLVEHLLSEELLQTNLPPRLLAVATLVTGRLDGVTAFRLPDLIRCYSPLLDTHSAPTRVGIK